MIRSYDVYPSGTHFDIEITGFSGDWAGDSLSLHVTPNVHNWTPGSGGGISAAQLNAIESMMIAALDAAMATGDVSGGRVLRKDEQISVSASRP